jgi:hypothetical protein
MCCGLDHYPCFGAFRFPPCHLGRISGSADIRQIITAIAFGMNCSVISAVTNMATVQIAK